MICRDGRRNPVAMDRGIEDVRLSGIIMAASKDPDLADVLCKLAAFMAERRAAEKKNVDDNSDLTR